MITIFLYLYQPNNFLGAIGFGSRNFIVFYQKFEMDEALACLNVLFNISGIGTTLYEYDAVPRQIVEFDHCLKLKHFFKNLLKQSKKFLTHTGSNTRPFECKGDAYH